MKGVREMGTWIRKKGYPREVVDAINDLLEALDPIMISELTDDWKEIIGVAVEHRLLSNDALIALAAKKHEVGKIISLDEDFDRVPWLQRIH